MYVTVGRYRRLDQNAIAVPDASVLRDDENQPFVYVANGSNSFGQAAPWTSVRARTGRRKC